MSDLPSMFLAFLQQKFAQEVTVGDAATDVMRQPLFPGLEAKPRELGAPAMPALPPEVMNPPVFDEGYSGGFSDGPEGY